MNLLLLEPGEIVAGEVVLHGRRAEHLLRVLGVAAGDTVRVGEVQGRLGSGRVLAVESGAVRLAVSLEREPAADLQPLFERLIASQQQQNRWLAIIALLLAAVIGLLVT